MSTISFESVLNAARQLPPEQQQQLIEHLLEGIQRQDLKEPSQEIDLVEKTFGTIKGVDRETLISIAEDEEFCGY